MPLRLLRMKNMIVRPYTSNRRCIRESREDFITYTVLAPPAFLSVRVCDQISAPGLPHLSYKSGHWTNDTWKGALLKMCMYTRSMMAVLYSEAYDRQKETYLDYC
jgi:hypothetical protein